jgi:hypothetical protein
MKITKNHVYCLLIAAAATAWAIDRFVLDGGVTGPAPASASALLVTPAAPGPTPTPLPAAAPENPLTLTARFARIALADNNAHDAFAPPESWLAPQTRPASAAAAAPAPQPPALDVAAFRSAHKLTAVFRTGANAGMAVIDGKMVEVGTPFAGLTLVAITQTSATLRGQGAEFALEIDATSGRGTLSPPPVPQPTPK